MEVCVFIRLITVVSFFMMLFNCQFYYSQLSKTRTRECDQKNATITDHSQMSRDT